MSSILTNNGAIVALQTLKSINANLNKAQAEISTGKSIASAQQNSAIWAISKVMESDVSAIKTISTALNTANATVSTARIAAEDIGEALKKIKDKVLTAQTASASDRAKLQDDINGFKDQIEGILGTAQFNGVNLIDGSSVSDYSVIASLDRSGGSVNASKIDVERRNLALTVGSTATPGTTAVTDRTIIANGATGVAGTAETLATGNTQNIGIVSVGSGYTYGIALDDSAGANILGAPAAFTYTATAGDSAESVASNLALQVQDYLARNGVTAYSVTVSGSQISLVNNSGDDLSVNATSHTGGTPATGGGLAALNTLSVATDGDAASALVNIEALINTAIDAAAQLGTSQNRIDSQYSFIGKLADQMTVGIGSLVDADMEEASARLQALQTQQQLGIQSLSIANQAPAAILALFR